MVAVSLSPQVFTFSRILSGLELMASHTAHPLPRHTFLSIQAMEMLRSSPDRALEVITFGGKASAKPAIETFHRRFVTPPFEQGFSESTQLGLHDAFKTYESHQRHAGYFGVIGDALQELYNRIFPGDHKKLDDSLVRDIGYVPPHYLGDSPFFNNSLRDLSPESAALLYGSLGKRPRKADWQLLLSTAQSLGNVLQRTDFPVDEAGPLFESIRTQKPGIIRFLPFVKRKIARFLANDAFSMLASSGSAARAGRRFYQGALLFSPDHPLHHMFSLATARILEKSIPDITHPSSLRTTENDILWLLQNSGDTVEMAGVKQQADAQSVQVAEKWGERNPEAALTWLQERFLKPTESSARVLGNLHFAIVQRSDATERKKDGAGFAHNDRLTSQSTKEHLYRAAEAYQLAKDEMGLQQVGLRLKPFKITPGELPPHLSILEPYLERKVG
ncbi:MAG: hypothetical protein HY540_06260 [Deltaproteobacteria bacterium]|nr:hypothetical protein [Deltaproteobacteria bacterium]